MDNGDLSPLIAIKKREMELADSLANAKQAAERQILEARQWATHQRELAEIQGKENAQQSFLAELSAAESEAERIQAEGERIAAALSARRAGAKDEAVSKILNIILPKLT